MLTIHVRESKFSDLQKVIQLYSGWQEFKGVLPDELIALETESELAPYISGVDPSRRYVVAIDKRSELLGICYMDLTFEVFQVIRIGDFIVNKQYRHQGIGKKILNYIINYAKEKNIKKLWLWTQGELTEAIKFYEANGFTVEGKQKAQFLGRDAILLGLVL